ncbi:hypothetical protein FJQ54_10785 [Sandaracinobacter neustonicus]|uniref:TonB-dependent receptor plug domain-containing protein n=1 Tax=Sandaracinobacter neustonicus TaxID=1715348 RepID=A0A501XJK5_9SPHN|nr:TonB-dependent receptor plug domain-containing protein [Sandaracinobacter neustonicus]TPE60483.1 hypothetical protein FJQ54_10785 [Sandaracinobacter neustonicus]
MTGFRVGVAASAIVAAMTATPAIAADQAAPATGGATAGADVEDIIVTGRRRTESLERLPSAGDVIRSETLEDRGVETGKDLSHLIPGVQVLDNGTGMNDEMIIRGEGATRQNNIEPGAGLYRDGMFIAGGNVGGRNFVGLDFFDVSRVEVLRGPQGSYFGRNAIGGAINIISARPGEGPQGRLRFDVGSQDRIGVEGITNVKIGELGLRLGGFYNLQQGGWYRSTVTGNKLDYSSSGGARLSAVYDPTPNWSLSGLVEYGAEDAPAPQVFEYTLPVNDPPINNPGPTGFYVDRFEKALDLDPRLTRNTFSTMLNSKWQFGGVELISMTGYRRRDATSLTDADFNASTAVQRALTATGTGSETFERFVQDLRLQSTGDGLRWVIGGEYNKVDSDFATALIPIVPTTLPPGCLGGVCTLPVAQATARAVYRRVNSEIDDLSWAAYGALTWPIADRFELSGDFRYTIDRKRFDSVEVRRLDNPATPVNEQVTLTIDRERTFRVFTPGVSVSYFTDSGSIFARLATGYRGGGFNNDPGEPGDGVSDVALPPVFEPEYVTSVEAGVKGRIEGLGRFEVSAYHNWKSDTFVNYSVFVGCGTVARPGCAANSVRNVGAVRNAGNSVQYGIEAEWSGTLAAGSRGRILYAFNGALAGGEYKEGYVYQNSNSNPATTLSTRDLKGKRLGRLRDLTGSATLGYSHEVADGLRLFANGSVRAELGGYEDPGNTIPYDDVVLVDTNLGLRAAGWSVVLIGKNVLNNSYYNISPLNQTFGTQSNQPRTWMLRTTLSF